MFHLVGYHSEMSGTLSFDIPLMYREPVGNSSTEPRVSVESTAAAWPFRQRDAVTYARSNLIREILIPRHACLMIRCPISPADKWPPLFGRPNR